MSRMGARLKVGEMIPVGMKLIPKSPPNLHDLKKAGRLSQISAWWNQRLKSLRPVE